MIIPSRFNGPPGSANGGYTAGLVAGHLSSADAVEVTLRRPPPLDRELAVAPHGPAGLRVFDADLLVAEARAVEPGPGLRDGEGVPPVPYDEAVTASAGYLGFATHPYPTCFVCGPERAAGDGLRLFPGRLPDGRTAAPFVAPDVVTDPLVWAALDCPSGWSIPLETRPYLLGRITARVLARPAAGERCVVMGAPVAAEGRKATARSTLYTASGEVAAYARAVWVAV
jgi:hypothetical protein